MKNERRSYGQLCGLGASLDLLDERFWLRVADGESVLRDGGRRFEKVLQTVRLPAVTCGLSLRASPWTGCRRCRSPSR